MAKPKTAYACSECGAYSVKWAGQCPDCDAWNTLRETTPGAAGQTAGAAHARTLADFAGDLDTRYASGFSELDRVLGGGVMPGAVILLGGDPGVGKSTLLQQSAARLAADVPVCYASGEESLRQVGQRASRLGIDASAMHLLADTALENILAEATRVAKRKSSSSIRSRR